MENFENVVLGLVLHDRDYCRKVMPVLKPELFEGSGQVTVFRLADRFINKYKKSPTVDTLKIVLEKAKGFTQDDYKAARELLDGSLAKKPEVDKDWALDMTEEWGKRRSIYVGITRSIGIMDGDDKELTEDAIPDLLKEALRFGFDKDIGHDYFEDALKRYAYYHQDMARVPFRLTMLNKMTRGGMPKGTETVYVAGTNMFKSGALCDQTAFLVDIGLNGVYFSMEMGEEETGSRVDANFLKTPMESVPEIPQAAFLDRIKTIREKSQGRLIIKEYPTATPTANTFRAFLHELELQKSIRPDFIVVDYLNICAPFRTAKSDNMYSHNKSIAEELRGLAMEYKCPLYTGAQLNRDGQDNSDPELKNVGESHGIAMTADFMIALVSPPDLAQQGKMMIQQLKNRHGDRYRYRRVMVGVDRARMTMFDLDEQESAALDNSGVPPASGGQDGLHTDLATKLEFD